MRLDPDPPAGSNLPLARLNGAGFQPSVSAAAITRPRCATRRKLGIQKCKGQADRQIAMLFERAACSERSLDKAAALARICWSVRSAWTERSLGRNPAQFQFCWLVDRQPSLLRGCRQMNFWQCRISAVKPAKLPSAEQVFSLHERQSPASNRLRNIHRPGQGEAPTSSLDTEQKMIGKRAQMRFALDQAFAWSVIFRPR